LNRLKNVNRPTKTRTHTYARAHTHTHTHTHTHRHTPSHPHSLSNLMHKHAHAYNSETLAVQSTPFPPASCLLPLSFSPFIIYSLPLAVMFFLSSSFCFLYNSANSFKYFALADGRFSFSVGVNKSFSTVNNSELT